MNEVKISLIVAMAQNRVIGAHGSMPWNLSSDLKYFKSVTLGKPVIMGRKTYDSIGKALPGRFNLVVSRQTTLKLGDATVVPDLKAAICLGKQSASCDGVDEIMIIGGGTIYEASLALADKLYVTHIKANPKGDTFFPPFEDLGFEPIKNLEGQRGEKDSADFNFVIYERVKKPILLDQYIK